MIKCGLAPVLLDLMSRGYATAFAMNGSAAIHDFEIALAGHTSEDVEAVLPDGRFGSAEETGREMNVAITEGDRDGHRHGRGARAASVATSLGRIARRSSLLLGAWQASVPVTVHVAIGTDTPHTHPAADGLRDRLAPPIAISACSARSLPDLHDGGVYLNVGSAVVMPEVFLKAVSVARNLGHPLGELHHRQLRFPAALPAEGERGGAAACATRAGAAIRSRAITRSCCRCWRPC